MKNYNYQHSTKETNRSKSIQDKYSQESADLETIRLNKTERSEILSVIIDVKLREIGKLETKKQVLIQCQTWMANKVLLYMNMLDEAQVKYLKQIQELTGKLKSKDNAIQEQIKIIGDFDTIIQNMEKKIYELKERNKQLEQTLQRQFEFKDQDMKKYVSVIKLQNQNKQLKTQISQLQMENTTLFEDLDKSRKDAMVHKSQVLMMQNQVFRLKARLQQQKRGDQSVKCFGEYKICYAFSVCMKPPEAKITKRMNGKFLRQVMIDGLIIRNKAPNNKGQSDELLEFTRTTRLIDCGSQCARPYLWKIKLQNITIEGVKKEGIHLSRNYIKKPVISGKQETKKDSMNSTHRMKQQFQRQIARIKDDVKNLIQELKSANNKRVQFVMQQKNSLQNLLDSRPSREEDLQYIDQLKEQNKQLMDLAAEANQRAQKAYVSMRQLKTQLDRYKSNSPLEIRPRIKRMKNIQGFNPGNTMPLTQRLYSRNSPNRSKSRDEEVSLTSVAKNSLGTPTKQSRNLRSSLSVYRNEYRVTVHQPII